MTSFNTRKMTISGTSPQEKNDWKGRRGEQQQKSETSWIQLVIIVIAVLVFLNRTSSSNNK